MAAGACGAVAWGVLSTQAGCQLQGSCEAQTVYVPAIPPGGAGQDVSSQGFGQGAGVYDTSIGRVWQTGPIEGTWLPYPGSQTYVFYPTLPDGGPFVGPYIPTQFLVSADPDSYTNPGSNGAIAAGNLGEFSGLPDGGLTGFVLTNDTCSPYFLWLAVAQEYATAESDGGAP